MSSKPVVRACLTPALYPIYQFPGSITVVVDIFRATSAICTALHHGVESVIPVANLDDTQHYQGEQYILAAERGGAVVDGYSFGNSPLSYMNNPFVKGKTLVLSTTNGTQAIEAARHVSVVCIGAFSNLSALTDWLVLQQKDVMILCAGWKNRFNLEDTLFAGALSDRLLSRGLAYDSDSDAVLAAQVLYQQAQHNMLAFLANSSHRNRLAKLDLEADINYCLQLDTAPVVPVLEGEKLLIAQPLLVQ